MREASTDGEAICSGIFARSDECAPAESRWLARQRKGRSRSAPDNNTLLKICDLLWELERRGLTVEILDHQSFGVRDGVDPVLLDVIDDALQCCDSGGMARRRGGGWRRVDADRRGIRRIFIDAMEQDDQPNFIVVRILNPGVHLSLCGVQIVLGALTPKIKRIHVIAVFRRFPRALRGSIESSVGIARSE